jgi:hypothetical protein
VINGSQSGSGGSNYYFDEQANILAISRSSNEETDRFFQLNEESTLDGDNNVQFTNVYETTVNENAGLGNKPGNYWNRIDDYSKVDLVVNFASADRRGLSISITGLLKNYGSDILQENSKRNDSKRIIGFIKTSAEIKARVIRMGDKKNPGGASNKYIIPTSALPVSSGIRSAFKVGNQSFPSNLSNGQGYCTDPNGNYIPIHKRPFND